MAKTTTDQTELTISPEALAAMAKALSEATDARNLRENARPLETNALGVPSKDLPSLRFKQVFFCGAPQTTQWLLPEEARLFNAITTPGLYGPDKTWEVETKGDDLLHVKIHGINRRETRLDLPRKLTDILRIIVDEQSAVAAA